ncbi:SUKH-3 domain-containing protein [Nocardia sp. NBC_01329]|uniref:SUKH-3 domain-containing protein n=1 Tax=Nocardia sp. NBC_01329 TaxID=2903594 RepID=UPI003FA34691
MGDTVQVAGTFVQLSHSFRRRGFPARVRRADGGQRRTRDHQHAGSIQLHPLLALGEGEDDRFGEWGEEIGRHRFPLGELDHGRFFLGLDEHGELCCEYRWSAIFTADLMSIIARILNTAPIGRRTTVAGAGEV